MALYQIVNDLVEQIALCGLAGCPFRSLWVLAAECGSFNKVFARHDPSKHRVVQGPLAEVSDEEIFEVSRNTDKWAKPVIKTALARRCELTFYKVDDTKNLDQFEVTLSKHGALSNTSSRTICSMEEILDLDINALEGDEPSYVIVASLSLRRQCIGVVPVSNADLSLPISLADLDKSQYCVLEAIAKSRRAGITQDFIRDAFNITPVNMHTILKRLESRYLIKRVSIPLRQGSTSRMWLTRFANPRLIEYPISVVPPSVLMKQQQILDKNVTFHLAKRSTSESPMAMAQNTGFELAEHTCDIMGDQYCMVTLYNLIKSTGAKGCIVAKHWDEMGLSNRGLAKVTDRLIKHAGVESVVDTVEGRRSLRFFTAANFMKYQKGNTKDTKRKISGHSMLFEERIEKLIDMIKGNPSAELYLRREIMKLENKEGKGHKGNLLDSRTSSRLFSHLLEEHPNITMTAVRTDERGNVCVYHLKTINRTDSRVIEAALSAHLSPKNYAPHTKRSRKKLRSRSKRRSWRDSDSDSPNDESDESSDEDDEGSTGNSYPSWQKFPHGYAASVGYIPPILHRAQLLLDTLWSPGFPKLPTVQDIKKNLLLQEFLSLVPVDPLYQTMTHSERRRAPLKEATPFIDEKIYDQLEHEDRERYLRECISVINRNECEYFKEEIIPHISDIKYHEQKLCDLPASMKEIILDEKSPLDATVRNVKENAEQRAERQAASQKRRKQIRVQQAFTRSISRILTILCDLKLLMRTNDGRHQLISSHALQNEQYDLTQQDSRIAFWKNLKLKKKMTSKDNKHDSDLKCRAEWFNAHFPPKKFSYLYNSRHCHEYGPLSAEKKAVLKLFVEQLDTISHRTTVLAACLTEFGPIGVGLYFASRRYPWARDIQQKVGLWRDKRRPPSSRSAPPSKDTYHYFQLNVPKRVEELLQDHAARKYSGLADDQKRRQIIHQRKEQKRIARTSKVHESIKQLMSQDLRDQIAKRSKTIDDSSNSRIKWSRTDDEFLMEAYGMWIRTYFPTDKNPEYCNPMTDLNARYAVESLEAQSIPSFALFASQIVSYKSKEQIYRRVKYWRSQAPGAPASQKAYGRSADSSYKRRARTLSDGLSHRSLEPLVTQDSRLMAMMTVMKQIFFAPEESYTSSDGNKLLNKFTPAEWDKVIDALVKAGWITRQTSEYRRNRSWRPTTQYSHSSLPTNLTHENFEEIDKFRQYVYSKSEFQHRMDPSTDLHKGEVGIGGERPQDSDRKTPLTGIPFGSLNMSGGHIAALVSDVCNRKLDFQSQLRTITVQSSDNDNGYEYVNIQLKPLATINVLKFATTFIQDTYSSSPFSSSSSSSSSSFSCCSSSIESKKRSRSPDFISHVTTSDLSDMLGINCSLDSTAGYCGEWFNSAQSWIRKLPIANASRQQAKRRRTGSSEQNGNCFLLPSDWDWSLCFYLDAYLRARGTQGLHADIVDSLHQISNNGEDLDLSSSQQKAWNTASALVIACILEREACMQEDISDLDINELPPYLSSLKKFPASMQEVIKEYVARAVPLLPQYIWQLRNMEKVRKVLHFKQMVYLHTEHAFIWTVEGSSATTPMAMDFMDQQKAGETKELEQWPSDRTIRPWISCNAQVAQEFETYRCKILSEIVTYPGIAHDLLLSRVMLLTPAEFDELTHLLQEDGLISIRTIQMPVPSIASKRFRKVKHYFPTKNSI